MSRSFFAPSAWRGTHRPATRTTKTSSGSILGDLLVRFGWVKPTLEPEDLGQSPKVVRLADVDPVLADLKRKEALARARHGNVRDIREARRARVHQLLAGRA